MRLKRALRNSKDKRSTVYIISLSSACHRPHHSTIYGISMSSLFHCPRHSCISARSFAVRCGDHLRFGDHLQFNLRIICGRGSFPVSGSFVALYYSFFLWDVQLCTPRLLHFQGEPTLRRFCMHYGPMFFKICHGTLNADS